MNWMLPPGLSDQLIHGYGRWLMRGSARNRELQGRHAGERRCFVVGNGPSLKTHDITVLKNEVTIVANSFYIHPDGATVAPQYCCIGDHRFFADEPNNVQWFREQEQAFPETTYLVHSAGRKLFETYGLMSTNRVYYRNRGRYAHRPSGVEVRLDRPFTAGHSTVTAMSIPLAIALGFSSIYLVGCDANWLADPKAGGGHFYKSNKLYPQYDHGVRDADELELTLKYIHRDFQSHRLYRDRAKKLGIEIVNATNGGWLEMYPRVQFESLFD